MAESDEWAGQRRSILVAVGCLRRHWGALRPAAREAVAAAERYADLDATKGDLWVARRNLPVAGRLDRAARDVTYMSVWESMHPRVLGELVEAARDAGGDPAAAAEVAAHAAVRSDIRGRWVRGPFDPGWRTPTAVAVAAGIYAGRAFDQLPVLADALEDAGCDAADLLGHLRGPGPHVRGCWALDLVLDKG